MHLQGRDKKGGALTKLSKCKHNRSLNETKDIWFYSSCLYSTFGNSSKNIKLLQHHWKKTDETKAPIPTLLIFLFALSGYLKNVELEIRGKTLHFVQLMG